LRVVVGDVFSMDQAIAKLRSRMSAMLPGRVQAAIDLVLSRQRWKERLSRKPKGQTGLEAV
jgi:hypothetical protein